MNVSSTKTKKSFIAIHVIVWFPSTSLDCLSAVNYHSHQDQTYVANLGIVLPQMKKTVIDFKFTLWSHVEGESAIGREFFFQTNEFSIIDAPLISRA